MEFNQSGSLGDDSLEYLKQFWLAYFPVAVLVHSTNELVHFLLAHLSSLAHVLQSVIDQKCDFVGL